MSYGQNNNNNSKSNPTTSRKVIIHRKPSISDSSKPEENNNNYTDLDTATQAHSADLKNNNNNNNNNNNHPVSQNSVTLYGVNGSASSFPANIEPSGFVNMQPGTKRPRYLSPPPNGANFNQQYPQGRTIIFYFQFNFVFWHFSTFMLSFFEEGHKIRNNCFKLWWPFQNVRTLKICLGWY